MIILQGPAKSRRRVTWSGHSVDPNSLGPSNPGRNSPRRVIRRGSRTRTTTLTRRSRRRQRAEPTSQTLTDESRIRPRPGGSPRGTRPARGYWPSCPRNFARSRQVESSQTLIDPSQNAPARVLPSGENEMVADPSRGFAQTGDLPALALSASQTIKGPNPPEATYDPSGEKATELIDPRSLRNDRISRPDSRSQTVRMPSAPPEATDRPSGARARELDDRAWGGSNDTRRSVGPQILTVAPHLDPARSPTDAGRTPIRPPSPPPRPVSRSQASIVTSSPPTINSRPSGPQARTNLGCSVPPSSDLTRPVSGSQSRTIGPNPEAARVRPSGDQDRLKIREPCRFSIVRQAAPESSSGSTCRSLHDHQNSHRGGSGRSSPRSKSADRPEASPKSRRGQTFRQNGTNATSSVRASIFRASSWPLHPAKRTDVLTIITRPSSWLQVFYTKSS